MTLLSSSQPILPSLTSSNRLSPSSPSSYPLPVTPGSITTTTSDAHHDHGWSNEPHAPPFVPPIRTTNTPPTPTRPPRSPLRQIPKRLDAEVIFTFPPKKDRSSWKRHTSSLSHSSLEYVRTALRNFRSSIPAQRFPDKSPIRSPSRRYQRASSFSGTRHEGLTSVTEVQMSSDQKESEPRVDELVKDLRAKGYERYGSARAVRREGVGGHWRSYSMPPPETAMGLPKELEELENEEGRRRVMSAEPIQPIPLHTRQPLPIFDEPIQLSQSTKQRASAPPPTLHIIHPSISTTPDDPSIYPPRRASPPLLHHTHGTVLDRDDSISRFATVVGMVEVGQASRSAEADVGALFMPKRPVSERMQTTRRSQMGPGGIISKIASRSSLSRLKIAFAPNPSDPGHHLDPNHITRLSEGKPSPHPASRRYTVAEIGLHRPAPLPPLLPSPTPTKFAPSSSRVPSPSPSATPAQSRAATPLSIRSYLGARDQITGISPIRSSIWGEEEGLIEIPRFKKRELNLGIISGGQGQRVVWGALWAIWVIWGLISLFFDVNVLYMLVQCAQNPSSIPDSASARTWVFAVAAYGICWLISILGVWIGWELCFEFWRRWRLPIEPIYTSLPATLHLSLTSFQHFTFFLYVRLSALRTPFAVDILPETAHMALQSLPGLGPVLPRASLAIVLLVAFSSGDSGINRDSAFWRPATGQLTDYSRVVLFAFVSFTALRILVVIISAIVLWIFSRPRRSWLRSNRRFHSRHQSRFDSFSTTSPVDTRPATPDEARPRDPADTQSPSKGWTAESELKWEWRERGRNRLQDAFELCMIRRPRQAVKGRGSSQKSPANGWQGSPSKSRGVSLLLGSVGKDRERIDDRGLQEMMFSPSPTSADPFIRIRHGVSSTSTVRFATPTPDATLAIAGDPTSQTPISSESPTTPISHPSVQARPESELLPRPSTPPKSPESDPITPIANTRHPSIISLEPRTVLGNLHSARQSASSQDLFYTPMSGTPAIERTEFVGSSLGSSSSRRDQQSRASSHSGPSTTHTPPSAYRRPVAPGPGPSTAGISSLTIHALGHTEHLPETNPDSDQENLSNPLELDIESRSNGISSPIPDQRISIDTVSGESITDDRAALLSRSSVYSDGTTNASHPSHASHPSQSTSNSHGHSATKSLRRASQILRDRSASLISGSRRASYSALKDDDGNKGKSGGVTEFGANGVRRERSTSVGLLRESVKGSVRKVKSGISGEKTH